MLNSIDLIDATLNTLVAGPVKHDLRHIGPTRNTAKTEMQGLISHFKQYSEDFRLAPAQVYVGVETPKGELGAFLISDGSSKPYRCKIRPTGISHLQALNYMVRGLYIPDVVAAIGTQDIVFGEVDR
jgi:NADH:ubiquinone oxidoreductase subunit D